MIPSDDFRFTLSSHDVRFLVSSHDVWFLMSSHDVRFLVTSHDVRFLMSPHDFWFLMSSHDVWFLMSSHDIRFLMSSHYARFLTSPHDFWFLMSSHDVRFPMSPYDIRFLISPHDFWFLMCSHYVRFLMSSHDIRFLMSSHDVRFLMSPRDFWLTLSSHDFWFLMSSFRFLVSFHRGANAFHHAREEGFLVTLCGQLFDSRVWSCFRTVYQQCHQKHQTGRTLHRAATQIAKTLCESSQSKKGLYLYFSVVISQIYMFLFCWFCSERRRVTNLASHDHFYLGGTWNSCIVHVGVKNRIHSWRSCVCIPVCCDPSQKYTGLKLQTETRSLPGLSAQFQIKWARVLVRREFCAIDKFAEKKTFTSFWLVRSFVD